MRYAETRSWHYCRPLPCLLHAPLCIRSCSFCVLLVCAGVLHCIRLHYERFLAGLVREACEGDEEARRLLTHDRRRGMVLDI
jgi:hypothetical protein